MGIGPVLVKGCAASGDANSATMANAIPAAGPAPARAALMLAFSAEIAAISSLWPPDPGL
jgi:hypothetical protein